jgi:hypothetical protein
VIKFICFSYVSRISTVNESFYLINSRTTMEKSFKRILRLLNNENFHLQLYIHEKSEIKFNSLVSNSFSTLCHFKGTTRTRVENFHKRYRDGDKNKRKKKAEQLLNNKGKDNSLKIKKSKAKTCSTFLLF